MLLSTLWTIAVRESRFGMTAYVIFDGMPFVVFIPYFLAETANRQYAFQDFDVCQCLLQRFFVVKRLLIELLASKSFFLVLLNDQVNHGSVENQRQNN